jgi:hypothetical protein
VILVPNDIFGFVLELNIANWNQGGGVLLVVAGTKILIRENRHLFPNGTQGKDTQKGVSSEIFFRHTFYWQLIPCGHRQHDRMNNQTKLHAE